MEKRISLRVGQAPPSVGGGGGSRRLPHQWARARRQKYTCRRARAIVCVSDPSVPSARASDSDRLQLTIWQYVINIASSPEPAACSPTQVSAVYFMLTIDIGFWTVKYSG